MKRVAVGHARAGVWHARRRMTSLFRVGRDHGMKLAVVLLSALLAVVPGMAGGQDVPDPRTRLELTLADAIALALRNNRELIKARLNRALQKLDLDVARDEFRPKATVSTDVKAAWSSSDPTRSANININPGVTLKIPTGGSFSVEWNNEATDSSSSEKSYDTSFRFGFTQPLLKGAGVAVNTASIEKARRQEEANLLRFGQTIADTVVKVIGAYWDIIQDGHEVDIDVRSLKRAREQLAVNRLLVRTGRMAERDLIQSEAQVAAQERSLEGARIELDNSRLALTDLLDIDGRTLVEATETLAVQRRRPDLARSTELALRNNTDHLQALLSLEDARSALLSAEDNNRLWDLSLDSSAILKDSGKSYADALSGAFDKTVDYNISLDLNVPLQKDRSKERTLLSAKIGLRNAQDDIEEKRRSIVRDVRNKVRAVESGFRQVELAQRARELEEEKLEIEREKIAIGLSSNFQLVRFEDDLVVAQNAEIAAKISYFKAVTALDHTLGTILDTWRIDVRRLEE